MSALHLFQLATRLNTQNPYESKIHNEFIEINLFIYIGISNWHIWSIDHTNMTFLPIFQFEKRKLTSKQS